MNCEPASLASKENVGQDYNQQPAQSPVAIAALQEHTPAFSPSDDSDEHEKEENLGEGGAPPSLPGTPKAEQPPVGKEPSLRSVTEESRSNLTVDKQIVFTGEDDSSGSSLSDNDWLDEDLLPRR